MSKQFEIQARRQCCDENDGDDNEWRKPQLYYLWKKPQLYYLWKRLMSWFRNGLPQFSNSTKRKPQTPLPALVGDTKGRDYDLMGKAMR